MKRKDSESSVLPRRRPQAPTSRELEVLGLIWQGLTNRQIGEKLEISIKTVEAHRATMMKRFRASNTAELLRTGIENGLLKLHER